MHLRVSLFLCETVEGQLSLRLNRHLLFCRDTYRKYPISAFMQSTANFQQIVTSLYEPKLLGHHRARNGAQIGPNFMQTLPPFSFKQTYAPFKISNPGTTKYASKLSINVSLRKLLHCHNSHSFEFDIVIALIETEINLNI